MVDFGRTTPMHAPSRGREIVDEVVGFKLQRLLYAIGARSGCLLAQRPLMFHSKQYFHHNLDAVMGLPLTS
jgi:hypothetical protein